MSNLFIRLFKCSSAKCSVRFIYLPSPSVYTPLPKGFLPVAFAWIRERRQTPPVHLPEEEGIPRKHPVQRLTGWKILLLWLPAACDLTGTTVRPPIFCRSRLSPSPLTVDEYRAFIHSRIDLSNDERCSRPFCRYSQCRIFETPAVVLPVEHPALSPEIILTSIYRWFSLLTVMAGIALVGLSGSLIQDTAKNSLLAEEPPEATTVLLGKFTFHYYFRTRAELYQACSSFYSLRSCRSPTHTLRASRS